MMAVCCCMAFSAGACSSDDNTGNEVIIDPPTRNFYTGADVSWVTEMEASGRKFYDANGKERDALTILHDMGTTAVRLRVWVSPADGWNGKEDVLKKALRAKNLGMPVMVDFHYSDTWADPGAQTIPAAWTNYSLAELRQAVVDHTKDVLKALKEKGVDVPWVQVGNETRVGMLWPLGKVENNNFKNFAGLVNAGYDAVKSVYAGAKVIVHVDKGNEIGGFTWLFDGLKAAGAKWDMIGMSLYPDDSSWQQQAEDCIKNMRTLSEKYNCNIILSEAGMSWDSPNADALMTYLVQNAAKITRCEGVFYWEPECYGGWKDYTKGAFDNSGKPTQALRVYSKALR